MSKNNLDSSYARIVDTPAITRTLVLISLFGCLAISIAYWTFNGFNETSFTLLLVSALCLILLGLTSRGYYKTSALLLYLTVSFVLTFNISIGHAVYDEGMLAFPLLILFSGLIFGKRAGALVTTITVLQISLIQVLADAGHVKPFEGAIPLLLVDTITTIIILASTGLLVWVVIDLVEAAVGRIERAEIELEESYNHTLAAWAKALELRGREVPEHNARVTSLAIRLAQEMKLNSDEIKQIRLGAILHDIGKMGIPEKILLKDSELTPAELDELKEHPRMGVEIIEGIDYLDGAMDIIFNHHERFDGTGFPRQIGGKELSIHSQIFAIVDCWDMIRTPRPCRDAMTDEAAFQFIKEQAGKKFMPSVVDAFLALDPHVDRERNS